MSHRNSWEFIRAARGLLWLFSLSPLGGRGNRECRWEARAENPLESVKTLFSSCCTGEEYPACVGSFSWRCSQEEKGTKLHPSPLQELPGLFYGVFLACKESKRCPGIPRAGRVRVARVCLNWRADGTLPATSCGCHPSVLTGTETSARSRWSSTRRKSPLGQDRLC